MTWKAFEETIRRDRSIKVPLVTDYDGDDSFIH